MTKNIKNRSVVAALPIMVCLTLPLVQVANIAYLYDLAMLFSVLRLGFPRIRDARDKQFVVSIVILLAAVAVGTVSGILRAGDLVRQSQYAIQYFAAIIFALSLYLNILSGRVDSRTIVRLVSIAAMVLGAFAVLHYFLMTMSRPVGEALYLAYLKIAGFSDHFFTERYLRAVDLTGVVRATGTWDVATTFGGIMSLAIAWSYLVPISPRLRLVVSVLGAIAILASNSRHAWVILFIIFVLMVPAQNRLRRLLFSIVCVIGLVVSVNVLSSQSDAGTLNLFDQMGERFSRTFEQGLADSSIQLRYVDGTLRFLTYSIRDPSVLLFGIGVGTDKALFESMGAFEYAAYTLKNDHFGFVSNGWLLIWRNWGVLGFLGLVGIFWSISRTGGAKVFPALLVAGLIVAADNYAVHVARCFFLVLAYLAMVAGLAGLSPTSVPGYRRGIKFMNFQRIASN
ncbi:hypothetical protein [Parvibaculum sp.]|uniref:hypothetical protein n=1 Tax=Parvibaculum sp. TaxID=2024848 RepID=UPI00391D3DE0